MPSLVINDDLIDVMEHSRPTALKGKLINGKKITKLLKKRDIKETEQDGRHLKRGDITNKEWSKSCLRAN